MLWEKHCVKDFRGSRPRAQQTWRELYLVRVIRTSLSRGWVIRTSLFRGWVIRTSLSRGWVIRMSLSMLVVYVSTAHRASSVRGSRG